jgi:carboxyl-terminal processing protease
VSAADKDKSAPAEYTNNILNAYQFIQKNYVDKVDPKTLYQGAMKGLFSSLNDPYSEYLDEADMEDLTENIVKGNYAGVGLYVSQQQLSDADKAAGKHSFIQVASPIENGPGWKAGIKPGDLIIAVDGVSTADVPLNDIVAKLKGKAGEKVSLTIRRISGDGPTAAKVDFDVSLVRAVVEVPTVKSAMIGKTGYLDIMSFSDPTPERAEEALESFAKAGYTSLIVDLRDNYGGLLASAVTIADDFLESGTIVSVKSRIAAENYYYSAKAGTIVPPDMPLIVLINEGSASASEILAGALKDQKRAWLLGTRSYGKGSVQQIFPLRDKANDGYKITVARYYSPSDVNIDKIGILPDQVVEFPQFTKEDSDNYGRLLKDKVIPDWVGGHPKATDTEIGAEAQLISKTYPMDLSFLRRIIRDEENRSEIAPVYDLDYDVQLKAAVDILNTPGKWQSLMKTVKTLKQIQDEQNSQDALAPAA